MAAVAPLPHRIILSRKGWDTKSGGGPSPIFEDGTLLSLPIPDCRSEVRFRDLRSPADRIDLSALVKNLSRGRLTGESELHLDPDLLKNAVTREDFQPAFGQCGGAQSHLRKRCVDIDDLFLFFGLYQQVEERKEGWRYARPAAQHVIFGWLQVERILRLPEDDVPNGLKPHPHAIPSFIVEKALRRRSKSKQNNTIYLPRKRLTFLALAGSGLFEAPFCPKKYDPRRISELGQELPTKWDLPSFFSRLSNMEKKPPAPVGKSWRPQRKGPGQEFVLDVTGKESEVREWLSLLFQKAVSA